MSPRLDKRQLRRHFERAAATYDSHAVLQRRVADVLLQRLDLIKRRPAVILDAGCGTGYGVRALIRRYPGSRVIGLDLAHGMARRCRARRGGWRRPPCLCADAEAVPLADDSVDMVFSSLTLQWCEAQKVLSEFYRVLRPGGLLMFSSFGPDTLKEMRAAWRAVDAGPHVHEFVDMHDLGDLLVQGRYADPVMDMERMVLTYPSVGAALRELKAIGASQALADSARGLMGKGRFRAFVRAYEARARDGRIPASYEIVYGHAWVPEVKPQSLPVAPGVAVVPVSRVRRRSS